MDQLWLPGISSISSMVYVMTKEKQRIGNLGESAACEHLTKRGLEILVRNYRTPHGEIDIIARDGDTIRFCEVKTRTSDLFGNPEEAVTESKMQHLIDSAEHYLQSNNLDDINWQIDVIAVEIDDRNNVFRISRYENVESDE